MQGWSPDRYGRDESGFSDEQFDEFGAGYGKQLYEALREAAKRGVQIRILQSRGFEDDKTKEITPPNIDAIAESEKLAREFQDQVQIQTISMDKWYGAGIMHQKIWIFDNQSIYIGSANMDWKSISQVKELGVVTEVTHPLQSEV